MRRSARRPLACRAHTTWAGQPRTADKNAARRLVWHHHHIYIIIIISNICRYPGLYWNIFDDCLPTVTTIATTVQGPDFGESSETPAPLSPLWKFNMTYYVLIWIIKQFVRLKIHKLKIYEKRHRYRYQILSLTFGNACLLCTKTIIVFFFQKYVPVGHCAVPTTAKVPMVVRT